MIFSNIKSKNIALIGFSATGKSTISNKVADLLGWESVDTDLEITKLSGHSIPQIFEQQGEDAFRRFEIEVLNKACLKKNVVISTGGGAILNSENSKLLSETCLVICLQAKAETIYQRLLQSNSSESSPEIRPLLNVENPLAKIKELKRLREPYYYSIADWTVHTDCLTSDEVSKEVLTGLGYLNRNIKNCAVQRVTDNTCLVKTKSRTYSILFGPGLLDTLGDNIHQLGLKGKIILISDINVFSLYGNKAKASLENSGYSVIQYVISPGESSKNIDMAIKIYDFLTDQKVQRADIVVALGGGVVGDLAGFVAATYLRGLSWIQVPTTLISMVDASIGGKVGVDHSSGKNLIGAFYQPSLVLADIGTLNTLPSGEQYAGWAEVIKYGLIQDSKLFGLIEANVEKLLALETDITTDIIKQCACIKSSIVSEDERDTGRRIILNFGHTMGHALEVSGNYKTFLHGEAVALGMVSAAILSRNLNLLSQESVDRIIRLIKRFHLPISRKGINSHVLISAISLDKKRKNNLVQWVLLTDIGTSIVHTNIPNEVVLKSISEVIQP
jgi:shikimate kinase / 3-dehydroquinate synthase